MSESNKQIIVTELPEAHLEGSYCTVDAAAIPE